MSLDHPDLLFWHAVQILDHILRDADFLEQFLVHFAREETVDLEERTSVVEFAGLGGLHVHPAGDLP